MSKTVLFFPGQASQYVGMGKELYELSDEVRALYKIASSEMDFDIARLSFEGPAEELKRTRFTQPAILLHSLAVLTVLGDRLPTFDFAAGHSLGEYGALAVTGAMSFEQAIKAVVKRASLMEKACIQRPGTMAAIMGLKADQAEAICNQASAEGVVIPANYNSAIQIAISGEIVGVEKAVELAREAKAKRAMILEVGGAFHSPLMEPARAGLEEYLAQQTYQVPSRPVVANVTAQPITTADAICPLLVDQVTSPVRWAQTMKYLVGQGVNTVYEIGPGKVLSGLSRRDMKPEILVNLDTLADIKAFTTA
ncbi:MAG: [acyl-carrier-protein] S-malonyltransferase [Candidatus Zixiibacteriota bacterium]|nr:MAG: [acyl-carrier-protein] S-malonyltransferase [candidate division Zixibacteria bacterium]